MNSSLTSLYRKGHSESSACSPRREQSASSTPASTAHLPPSAGTLVSTGGRLIDRGGESEKKNVFIDLCEEEPTNRAKNVCCTKTSQCTCMHHIPVGWLDSLSTSIHVHSCYIFCLQQIDVSLLEPEKSQKKSRKRAKLSHETTESHTLNKKGTALCYLLG